MDLLDIAKAKAMYGGGSGGGDLSIANVTVEDPNEYSIEVRGAYVALADFIYDYDRTDTQLFSDEFETRQVIMYKGVAMMHFALESGENIEIEGDAEQNNNFVKVTGDCTITIS